MGARRYGVPARASRPSPRVEAQRQEIRHILHGPRVQTKLTVGAPDDKYEREADRVADQVMRMRAPEAERTPLVQRDQNVTIRRLCTECKEELRRQPVGEEEAEEFLQANPVSAPPSKVTPELESRIQTLRGSGQPLTQSVRAFFEPRFGHDFSDVRTHTGARAAETARAVNARAFTLGSNIVFGAKRFQPNSSNGQRLLAHELSHTVQQRQGAVRLQRLVEVVPNATAAADILDQFKFLCPGGNFTLNGLRIESACTNSSNSCDGLCDATTDASRAYSIEVHNVTNTPTSVTLHTGSTETVPMPSVGPNTVGGMHPTIQMPSSKGSALAFGAFLPNGSPFVADNWRILGHEICGHARLNQSYAGRKGDRPGHDATINTENAIAGEHGDPARGKYSDARQGESFHSLPVGGAKLVFKLRDGWHHERVP